MASVTTGLAIAQAVRGAQALQATDAVVFQAAGRIISTHGCIYCIAPQRAAEITLLGGHLQANGVEPFNNPPLVAWIVQPFAGLSLSAYTLLSVAVEAAALLAALFIARRSLPSLASVRLPATLVALALVAPLPGLETLVFAQSVGVMLVALIGAYALVRSGHTFLAGLALSILLIKPQDVWLVPLVLIIARAWPILWEFALGAAAWVLTSLVLVSIGTLSHITDSLSQNQSQVQFTDGLPGIAASIAGPGWGFIAAAAGIAVAALVWPMHTRLRLDPLLAIDLGIALSLLFSPHIFSADLLLMGAVLIDLGRRDLRIALSGALLLDAAYLIEGPLFHTTSHLQAIAMLGLTVLVAAAILRRSAPGTWRGSRSGRPINAAAS